jgi:hypothetical protein
MMLLRWTGDDGDDGAAKRLPGLISPHKILFNVVPNLLLALIISTRCIVLGDNDKSRDHTIKVTRQI